jgi:hypothetical protein
LPLYFLKLTTRDSDYSYYRIVEFKEGGIAYLLPTLLFFYVGKMGSELLQSTKLASLDRESRIEAIAQILGYEKLPPTIEQFCNDPYYLANSLNGELYPFWEKRLKDIFPTCIDNSYPIVVLTGGKGCGKSTVSRIMAMYLVCRLFHLKDPYKTFRIIGGKNIRLSFFNLSVELAEKDFTKVLKKWVGTSPFFKEQKKLGKFSDIEFVADGPKSNAQLGSDVLFYNLSEINFVTPIEIAKEKLDESLQRFDSRFGKLSDYFGQIVLDSSSATENSVIDKFVNDNPYKNIYTVYCNQWIVKEHLGMYGRKGWFKVYKGDSTRGPFIISESRPLTEEMNADQVLEVPEEFRSFFEKNIEVALTDKAGISSSVSDKFFHDTTRLLKCFDLPNLIGNGREDSVIKFDFYDLGDRLFYRVEKALKTIPSDKVIYIRFDIGTVRDYTGVAIAYFDKWRIYGDNKNFKNPEIIIPLACGVSRYVGQQTSITHLQHFIMDLRERWEIGEVSMDQFGSSQLLQELTRDGIKAKLISVDKTDQAYLQLKNLANNELLHINDNELLKRELCELKYVNRKVDHPSRGSKDISDAVAGVILSLQNNLDASGNVSNRQRVDEYSKYMRERVTNTENVFQRMLQDMYNY